MNELAGIVIAYVLSVIMLSVVAFCTAAAAYLGWKRAREFWTTYRQIPHDLLETFHKTEAGKAFGEFCRTHTHIPRDHVLFQRALERHIEAYYIFQMRHPRIAETGYIKMYLDMRAPKTKCHLKLVA